MKSHINTRPTPKTPKSSPAARRLIRAVLKQHGGNKRAAARALRLPNDAQLSKMLNGSLCDTPAMKAALLRAEQRAKRAWAFEREAVKPVVAAEVVANQLKAVRTQLEAIEYLVKGDDSHEVTGR